MESSEEDDTCVVCEKQNNRATIMCSNCRDIYHLACCDPPKRRRPKLASGWLCNKCSGHSDVETAKDATPKKSNGKSPLKRLRRNTRAAKTAAKKKSKADMEQDSDEQDDDSDFQVKSEESSDASDEALSDSTPNSTPAPSLQTARRPHSRGNTATQPETNAHQSNQVFGMTGDNSAEQSEEEEENGPNYFVEYARNKRAKCKSCEEKFEKKQIRIGVRVRHSMFGMTTYYKHIHCTQICYSTAKKLAAEENKDADNVEPIEGFQELEKPDRDTLQAHMESNEEKNLLDERIPLSQDHYDQKAPMKAQDPSPHLTVPLLPYQREALAWMTAQEKGKYRGGILADEMGMGKTIQAIATILENVREKSDPGDKVRGGTLVVCPVVAVLQWKSEIEQFVDADYLSIYVHHGNKRMTLSKAIAKYDIVLTTYSIIEYECRKTRGWGKVACKYCKRRFLPDKLRVHNRYFCGPNARKSAAQAKQEKKGKKAAGEESDEDMPKKMTAIQRINLSRKRKREMSESDGEEEEPEPVKQKGTSPLHNINWTRIVLDEAHYIKDRKCNTAKSVFDLTSTYKWCLTGTPLQNRIGELFSLIRFLQIDPYAYYVCTKCECQMLDFNVTRGRCHQCPHPSTQHYSYFNKKVAIPIQAYGYVAEGKIAMLRLQNDVLQHVLLRRTKDGRADDLCLPPKLVRIRKDGLDEREQDFYEAIYTQSQAQFNTYVSSGTLLNNYAHIFDLLVRLRQAVDHPYLVSFSKSNPAIQLPPLADGAVSVRPVVSETPLLSNEEDKDVPMCSICHEEAEDVVFSKCKHPFCRECVKEFLESQPPGTPSLCPECDKKLTIDLSVKEEEETKPVVSSTLTKFHKGSILRRIGDLASFQTSTKIEALMQELDLMRVRDPSGKAIIFSQFVNMLDLIQHRLDLGGVKTVRLSGNMSPDARDKTIKKFRDDPTVTAFLISLKAGGVALNLTIASHIFLMDPWWNPAAENQAIDRTHRLGQFKPIQATRFIISDTIEERILQLQEKKRLIFEGTVGANVSAINRLTEEDLRFLFSR